VWSWVTSTYLLTEAPPKWSSLLGIGEIMLTSIPTLWASEEGEANCYIDVSTGNDDLLTPLPHLSGDCKRLISSMMSI